MSDMITAEKAGKLLDGTTPGPAERDALRAAVEGLIAVLDRNDKKGPIPDVEMMFCWLAAQEVRAAFRKIAPKGEAT